MRRRQIVGLLCSLACTGCLPAGGASTAFLDEPLGRSGARRRLFELARSYERLMQVHGSLEWSRYAGDAAGGDSTAARMGKLRAREKDIFEEAAGIIESQERTLLSPRQADLWRRGALGLRLLGDARATELGDELEAVLNGHRFVLDGRRVARGDLAKMGRSPDPRVRRRSRQLAFTLHEKAKPIAVELLKRRNALARELRIHSFYDELLRVRGIQPSRLEQLLDELFQRTRRRYAVLLRDLGRAVRKRRPEPWDFAFALRQLAREPPDSRFPAEAALDTAFRLFAAFGIDLEEPTVRVTVRDFAFGGQAISVRVPDDVRIVVRPAPGARFYSTLLHELGHAYAATRTRAVNPLFKGYEWVPGLSDPGFAEGLAEVFGRLLDERSVLVDRLGLTASEAGRLVGSRRLGALMRIRRGIGSIWFERGALARPDTDLDRFSLAIEARHAGALIRRGTEPVWATSPFLATYPVYTQSYILAAMMAVQVRAALKRKLGAQWISPAAGRHLAARAVADGARWTFDEKMIRATGSRLGAEQLVRFIRGRD